MYVGDNRRYNRIPLTYEILQPRLESGKSFKAIAQELGYNRSTVTKKARNLGLESSFKVRDYRSAELPDDAMLECPIHGVTRHHRSGGQRRNGHRCALCIGQYQQNRILERKRILVNEAGGACQKCGYNRSLMALDFHHRDPSIKEFGIGGAWSRSLDILRKEAAKCELLCKNCHAEYHEEFGGHGRPNPPT